LSKSNIKRVSLVLGSGGARGYAHIGVIEELEARGYEIACISGSSMGALIGGLYACGKLQEYKDWVLELDALDVASLLDFSWNSKGVVRGKKLMSKLDEIIGEVFIEELPIDYTAVATELRRNREVWFQEGRLLDAIRASISIPTFFTPVEYDGMLLVDGGVLNPLPVAPTMSTHSDITIAVSLFGEDKPPVINMPKSIEQRESKLQTIADEMIKRARKWFEDDENDENEFHLFDIFDMTLESMQKTLIGYRLGGYPPDIIIDIPQGVCSTLDFHRAYEVIETGRVLTQRVLSQLE